MFTLKAEFVGCFDMLTHQELKNYRYIHKVSWSVNQKPPVFEAGVVINHCSIGKILWKNKRPRFTNKVQIFHYRWNSRHWGMEEMNSSEICALLRLLCLHTLLLCLYQGRQADDVLQAWMFYSLFKCAHSILFNWLNII